MLSGIVKYNRLINMCSTLRDFSCRQQREAFDPIGYDERSGRLLLLRERQELRRNLANKIAVERYNVHHPQAVEDTK